MDTNLLTSEACFVGDECAYTDVTKEDTDMECEDVLFPDVTNYTDTEYDDSSDDEYGFSKSPSRSDLKSGEM